MQWFAIRPTLLVLNLAFTMLHLIMLSTILRGLHWVLTPASSWIVETNLLQFHFTAPKNVCENMSVILMQVLRDPHQSKVAYPCTTNFKCDLSRLQKNY